MAIVATWFNSAFAGVSLIGKIDGQVPISCRSSSVRTGPPDQTTGTQQDRQCLQRHEGKHMTIAKPVGRSRMWSLAKPEGALIMELHATRPSAPDESEYKENETLGRKQAYD